MDDPDTTDVDDVSGNNRPLNVYGVEQYPLQPSFLDDGRNSWLVDASLVISPGYPPERLGLQDSSLVEEAGSTWVVSANPAGGSNLFRIDVSNSSYLRVIWANDGFQGSAGIFAKLISPGVSDVQFSYSNFGTAVDVPYDGEPRTIAAQYEPLQQRLTIWVDFVLRAVWYVGESLTYGAASERVFSFADRGNMTMQHGVNFNRVLNFTEMEALKLGYDRSFLGYVTPPVSGGSV